MADLQMFMQRILICGLTICIILVIGHCLFLEILFTRHLKERYRVFREMHEQYIPEFVIDKEKIIRAKLVK